MITQNDMQDMIVGDLPDFEIVKDNKERTPFRIARQMIRYTSQQLAKKNVDSACKCVRLADKLYRNGNNLVKMAIENEYVYALSRLLNQKNGAPLKDNMPPILQAIYKKQVLYSHL